MTVQVETYELTETGIDGVPECEAEAMELIQTLGLTGQQKLFGKKEETGETVRCPYRKMSASERFVYDLLLPVKTKIESYESGCIPLRVLQVASHARPLFKCLYVLHTADRRDPVLIGCEGPYATDYFILARWDDVLESFGVLAARACKLFRDQYKAKLAEFHGKMAAAAAEVAAMSDDVLVDAGKTLPTFYA